MPNGAANARVLLPETGRHSSALPRAELEARFSGVVLFVRPHFRFDARTPPARGAAAPRSRHWFWSALLAAALRLPRRALGRAADQPLRARVPDVLDERLRPRRAQQRGRDAVGAGDRRRADHGADLFMRQLRSHFVDEASARIDVQISATLMERVLGMRLENRPESVGSFASNLRGFEQVRDFIASSTVTALIDLPFALIFVVVIVLHLAVARCCRWWWCSPSSSASAMCCSTGCTSCPRPPTRPSAQRNATLIESLTGIETIKSQGAESVIQAKWERANVFLARTNVQDAGAVVVGDVQHRRSRSRRRSR
jgi:ATP-binding cassette subfamily C protein LapB